jgi:hypothetical protein
VSQCTAAVVGALPSPVPPIVSLAAAAPDHAQMNPAATIADRFIAGSFGCLP